MIKNDANTSEINAVARARLVDAGRINGQSVADAILATAHKNYINKLVLSTINHLVPSLVAHRHSLGDGVYKNTTSPKKHKVSA